MRNVLFQVSLLHFVFGHLWPWAQPLCPLPDMEMEDDAGMSIDNDSSTALTTMLGVPSIRKDFPAIMAIAAEKMGLQLLPPGASCPLPDKLSTTGLSQAFPSLQANLLVTSPVGLLGLCHGILGRSHQYQGTCLQNRRCTALRVEIHTETVQHGVPPLEDTGWAL